MRSLQDVLQDIEASQAFDLGSLENALDDIDAPEKNSPTSSLRHSNGLAAPQSPSINVTPTKLYNPHRRRHQRHKSPRTSSPRQKIPIYCRRLFR